jgi:hypothetical protein
MATAGVIERAAMQSPAIIGRGLRLPDMVARGPAAWPPAGFIGRLLKVAVPSTNHGNQYKLHL